MQEYTHTCPFESQGLIHKIIYVGKTKSIIVYECDECMAFWDNQYNQTRDNAIGHAYDGGDNDYFEKQGIGIIKKVIDEGSYY